MWSRRMTTPFNNKPFSLMELMLLFSLFSLAGCDTIRVGFIYITTPSDFGWTFTHDNARVNIDSGDPDIVTRFRSNVSPDAAVEVAKSLVDQGFQLIIFTSPEYQTGAEVVADLYPSVYVVVADGNGTRKNLAGVQARIVTVFLLGGVIAGSLTKTNQLAFIAAIDNANIRRSAQAFLIGARLVNPECRLFYVANQKFLDTKRTKKEIQLLKQNYRVDVFTGRDYDLTLADAATGGVGGPALVFGFPTGFPRVLFGENVFSGCSLDWTGIWTLFIKMARNGTWIPNNTYTPPAASAELSPFSTLVIPRIQILVSQWDDTTSSPGWCTFNNVTVGAPYPPSAYGPDGCMLNTRNTFYNFTKHVTVLDYFTDDQLYTAIISNQDSPFAITLMSLVGVLDVVLLISILFVFKFRHTVLVISTNQFFCYSILFGSAMGYSDLFFWFGTPVSEMCNARVWFLCLGFSFVFGALAGKTYKMWRIWTNPEIKESQQSNYVLFTFIALLFVVNVALLIALILTNGYAPGKIESAKLSYDQYYLECSLSTQGQILLGLILGFNGVVIIVTAGLAYLSRNVNKRFNEMPSIVISIYSILVAATVLVLLFVIIDEPDPTKRAVIMTCGIMIGNTFPLISIFGPKFYKLWKEVSSSHSHGSGSITASGNTTNSSKSSGNVR